MSGWKWAMSTGVNLLLGILAIIPLWMLLLFVLNFPLASMGLSEREPTENDGMLPWLIILVPLLVGTAALWLTLNALMRRRTGLPGRSYWSISSATVLVPTVTTWVLVTVL
ncbi:hypothetical protein [Streptomyces sp. SP18CS02]|uniref:hypothetical protein n=1 Tax=Streptomyces sp. SP18CS02 TaxID=3002531 RepID=UPI002E787517|nr:hypothetical protein [Streptomyces sp. SP18CS02]MEE1753550.1 hypothetical protein [Streptomyces sp. SP18CS02]